MPRWAVTVYVTCTEDEASTLADELGEEIGEEFEADVTVRAV